MVIMVLATLVFTGCGDSAHHASLSPAVPPVIDIGQVGHLPPVRKVHGGPRLVLPAAQPISLPGRYPFNSILHFSVPIRNDGSKPLHIEQISSGCLCSMVKNRDDPTSSPDEVKFINPERVVPPGHSTTIRVEFLPTVDGSGRHTEYFHLVTNDKIATERGFRSSFATQIYYTVNIKPKVRA